MKRILFYCLILVGVLAIPVSRLDVGDLEPVQSVWIYRQGDKIVLETDTEDKGSGNTVGEALKDLKENCLGIIYLDTAQFLLVSENATDQVSSLKEYLKGSVRMCQWNGEGSMADAQEYMASHKVGHPLIRWKEGKKLPMLQLQKKLKNVEKK